MIDSAVVSGIPTKMDLTYSCINFAKKYKEIAIFSLADPFEYNRKFILEYPEFQGKLLYLCGRREPLFRREWLDERHRQYFYENFKHCVCILENEVAVDATHRQLENTGPVVNITSLEQLKKDWLILTYDWSLISSHRLMWVMSLQGTVEWQKKAYLDSRTDLEHQEQADFYKAEGKIQYNKIINAVNANEFIFTGTEEDNIHLLEMNNKYKLFYG